MSAFIGPNLYHIVSALGNGSAKLELAGGNQAEGTKIQIHNYDDHKNGQWVIASVGLGRSGKEEYAIINRASNTFLIAPGWSDIKNGATPTGGISAGAFNDRARWNIIPLNDGSGRYILTPCFNKKFSLNVRGAKHDTNATEIIMWSTGDNASQWYLRLAPDATSNSPDYKDTL